MGVLLPRQRLLRHLLGGKGASPGMRMRHELAACIAPPSSVPAQEGCLWLMIEVVAEPVVMMSLQRHSGVVAALGRFLLFLVLDGELMGA